MLSTEKKIGIQFAVSYGPNSW